VGPNIVQPFRYRPSRRSFWDTLLYTPTYRVVLVGVLAFAVFVAAMVLALRRDSPMRLGAPWRPPGASYHVRASGEIVRVGGGAVIAPATPEIVHVNLLDEQHHITAEFGHYPSGGAHYGIDLDTWTGTILHAPIGGTVTEVQRGCAVGDTQCGRGWGNHVWFQSNETRHYIESIYDWVEEGVTFDAGAPLGLTGNTGYSSGPHVHFQVNPGGMQNAGSINPIEEFPWLACAPPTLGALFGTACP
jgi:murein DD-endopeptidase MepM/ murein hydrolase activator NlpD